MRFNGGAPLSWSKLERILSGAETAAPVPVQHTAPAQSPQRVSSTSRVPFAELHAVSAYNFLSLSLIHI